MRKVFFLTDYKGHFGSKYIAIPYRSGFDKQTVGALLKRRGFEAIFLGFSDINFRSGRFSGELIVYTSAEDPGLFYKDYIEDILLGLQLQGAILIPRFEYFRAHHNKVFMEILRDILAIEGTTNVNSRYFGTLEEFLHSNNLWVGESVLKPSAGSMSAGIVLTANHERLARVRKVSRSMDLKLWLRDFVRQIRRRGYVKESWNRKKFIVQEYIGGLADDWKVLVYGKKLFVLNREVRKNDFRASGSGKFRYVENVPTIVLDLSERIARTMDVPWLSVDIAVANGKAYLFEFQVVYFGTSTLDFSEFWFEREGRDWEVKRGKSVVEAEFSESLATYIGKKYTR